MYGFILFDKMVSGCTFILSILIFFSGSIIKHWQKRRVRYYFKTLNQAYFLLFESSFTITHVLK
jgi:hypothetical protein